MRATPDARFTGRSSRSMACWLTCDSFLAIFATCSTSVVCSVGKKMYAHRTAKLPVPVHIPQGNSHKVTAVIKLKRPLFYLYGGAAAVLALLLLIRGDAAAQGVRDGIDLCVTSVIPALFPFFAASQLLVSLGAAEALGRAAGPLFRRLFGIDGAGAAAYLLGLIGGYPLGAKTAESLVRQGLLTPEDGALLLTFCNNAGPAFILGIAGSGVFRSSRAGVWLYLIHAAAATATGLLFCFIRKYIRKQNISGFFRFSASSCNFPSATAQKRPPLSAPAALIGAVRGGVAAMAGVCGFVIFFLVLLRLAESFLGPLPPLAAGLVELTNGILRLAPDRGGFVLAAALLGWGGLSVHCQTAAVLGGSGISMRWYLPAKAMQGAVSAVLAAAVWSWVI